MAERCAVLSKEARRLGLKLGDSQLELFWRYYQELRAWNERLNLTTIVEWEDVQIQHFLDSLSAALVLPDAAQSSPYAMVDVGSGGGFPGVPLKILLSHARLTLVESVAKKAAFLRHLVQVLGLEGVEVLAMRAEEAGRDPLHREAYDLALARAVAPLPVLVEYTLPMLHLGGRLIAHKGREAAEEVAAARAACAILGGEVREVRPVILPGMQGPRHLVVVEKVRPTPERYPRRPGMPHKRPL